MGPIGNSFENECNSTNSLCESWVAIAHTPRADASHVFGSVMFEAAADVVVLPSLWEGLSISLLEAMAAGRPVVTTTIASNREVTRDGAVAMLVPPKDSSRLTSALRDLAASPETREELAAAGRREQLERYSLARMLDQYLDEYDRLTNSPAHLRGEDRARRPV